jgi:hypothetical protein
MRSRKIFTLLLLLPALNLFSQKADPIIKNPGVGFLFAKKNSINFEAFGHGVFYSFSYERIFKNGPFYKFGMQGGASVYPYTGDLQAWLPISINCIRTLALKSKHHLEMGVGHVVCIDYIHGIYDRTLYSGFITAKFGYRFQKPSGPWIFKILLTPLYEYKARLSSRLNPNVNNGSFFYPSGALSIGYSF